MRHIKQQKQIRTFLIEEFGESKGEAVFRQQEEALDTLLKSEKNTSKSQLKTLTQMVLPCIALYKALTVSSEENAYALTRKYLLNRVGAKSHASTAKMEIVPGFYFIYSHIFLKIMRTSDLWKSTQTQDKDSFDVTIQTCLWHTACARHGCAKLCRLFCDADNVTYGGLKKIGFTRTQTLGYGGNCCDFHFFKKR